MDNQKYITIQPKRKKGQHLGLQEHGAIKALRDVGMGVRASAKSIGCSPTTVSNELRRGTPKRKSNRGRLFCHRYPDRT